MKKCKHSTVFILQLIFLGFLLVTITSLTRGPSIIGVEERITEFDMRISAGVTATVVSDGYDGYYWNNGSSMYPDIAIDANGTLHVVWADTTPGYWGGTFNDQEIMYANYSASTGWSNATVISDGYGGFFWNDDTSNNPTIAVGNDGVVHVVWQDSTAGVWGGGTGDTEIMYANYTPGIGWSNATVISDRAEYDWWNNGNSIYPDIAVDGSGNVHVVWEDWTNGPWKTQTSDYEIMYTNYTATSGWYNATVISDDYTGWNTWYTWDPAIAVDTSGNVHVVFRDNTVGAHGTDAEIWYVKYTAGSGWANATIVSDDATGWNNNNSYHPTIAVDNLGNAHVCWGDDTDGPWGTDKEIMYSQSADGISWTNATVISDDNTNSYTGTCYSPTIAIDSLGNIHVAWEDTSDQWPGTDTEIVYCQYEVGVGWSSISVVSDDSSNWNNGYSYDPAIAVDINNTAHVVWCDYTNGVWGTDTEIMYSPPLPDEGIPGFDFLWSLAPVLLIGLAALLLRRRKGFLTSRTP
jgi:hypothetical protein